MSLEGEQFDIKWLERRLKQNQPKIKVKPAQVRPNPRIVSKPKRSGYFKKCQYRLRREIR